MWRVESFLTQSSSCCIKNHYLYLHILSTAMHSCLIFFYQATSINLMIGDLLITCFQGVQKEASGMKWVNEEHNLSITSTSSSFITIADMAYFRVITSITSKKKKIQHDTMIKAHEFRWNLYSRKTSLFRKYTGTINLISIATETMISTMTAKKLILLAFTTYVG